MGHLLRWDTPTKTTDKARQIPVKILEEIEKQGQVWSLHPQCPKPVTYVGTKIAGYGFANDYYRDEKGVYWYESRHAGEPVVLEFNYGGGTEGRNRKRRGRTA